MIAYLVPHDLSFCVVLEMAVPLEAVLDQRAELLRERGCVEEVVHAEAGARRLGRVRRADALLRGPDARPAELDLLEPVDDLVEVEDEVSPVRDEEATGAVQACRRRCERRLMGR